MNSHKTRMFIFLVLLCLYMGNRLHAMTPYAYPEAKFYEDLKKNLHLLQHDYQKLATFFHNLLTLEVPNDTANFDELRTFYLKLTWLCNNSHYIQDLPTASQLLAHYRLNNLFKASQSVHDMYALRSLLAAIRLH